MVILLCTVVEKDLKFLQGCGNALLVSLVASQ